MEDKPLSPKRGNMEQKLQIAFANYMEYAHPDVLFFAVPNGGKRTMIEAALLKKMGVLAGVADCLLFWKGNFAAIELKRPDKPASMSPSQCVFRDRWVAAGGKFALCNSLDGCEEALKSWGLTSQYRVPIMEGSKRIMLQQVSMHELYRVD